MKIGLVLSRPPGYSETFFTNKIIFLQKSGFTVELFVDTKESGFNLCKQTSLPSQSLLNLIQSFLMVIMFHPIRLLKFIKTEIQSGNSLATSIKRIYPNLHLLQSSQITWLHFGFATMAIGRENIASVINAKMAVSFRGYDISRYPLKHSNAYNLLWKKVDKVHTISNALAKKAMQLGLNPNTPLVKITPAVNTNDFNISNQKQQFSNPIKITTVARLHWSKGLEYTIEALAILYKKGISFEYTIIGEGSELERLVLASHQFGITDKIKFVGKVNHSEIKSYLNKTDIYLQYSVQEGFCNAALEAQAMGLLCVVSDAEGLPENVLNNETGWIVPSREPELLAEKIIKILNESDAHLNNIRKNGIERVRSSFNLEIQREQFIEFYNNLHNKTT